MNYRDSHKKTGKGKSYHAMFTHSLYRKMVWGLEKKVLDDIFFEFFQEKRVRHLDFACGTGRIVSYIEDRSIQSIGVDVSSSMLEVAKEQVNNTELILADLTQDNVLHGKKFDLITAFRFFPNAEEILRCQAMEIMASLLDVDGYIVFNNHKHTGSLRNRLARCAGRRKFKGMSIKESQMLARKFGLEVVRIYGLCITPASERYPLLPIAILHPLEDALRRVNMLRSFGENLIFVCRHASMTQ